MTQPRKMLTVPARRPIKPVDIADLVGFIDAVVAKESA